jgi:hypothetical protein
LEDFRGLEVYQKQMVEKKGASKGWGVEKIEKY